MRDSGGDWNQYAHALMEGDFHLNLRLLPSLLIGGGMATMALGLLWRSRLAWVMAVLLAATGAVNTLLTVHSHLDSAGVFRITTAALLFAWRHFNRSSVAASTLFTLTAVVMLLLYATCGSYYLGAAFKPLCDGDHEHGRLPRYRSCCAGGETAYNFCDCSRRSGVRHLADRCDRTVG